MRKRLPALLLTVLLAIGPSLTSCSRETPAPAEEIAVPAAPRPTAKPVAKPEPQPQPEPEPRPEPKPAFLTDVSEADWYYDDVRTLFDLGALP